MTFLGKGILMDELRTMLYEKAKKCQTQNGAALLLCMKNQLDGRTTILDCGDLWKEADSIAGWDKVSPSLQQLSTLFSDFVAKQAERTKDRGTTPADGAA